MGGNAVPVLNVPEQLLYPLSSILHFLTCIMAESGCSGFATPQTPREPHSKCPRSRARKRLSLKEVEASPSSQQCLESTVSQQVEDRATGTCTSTVNTWSEAETKALVEFGCFTAMITVGQPNIHCNNYVHAHASFTRHSFAPRLNA